ncbi:MAG: LuxR C-terminal-related transcriptional regulator [Acidimicrobiales bacterium]
MVRVQQQDWRAIHDELTERELSTLSAAELDRLGESLFWLDRPDDSIDVLGKSFGAHVADGDHAGAVMVAWQLYYDHALVGDVALANGWLGRARRHATLVERSAPAGFLAVAESDHAASAGAHEDAVAHAERALELGHSTDDADLVAMALQAKGRALVACGRVDDGMSALEEAMIAAVNGELAPLFTGWVYCNALSTCHDVADLSRAVQWSEAAIRWSNNLRDGRLYRGICRLHVVELESLQGRWDVASRLARQACDDLTSHDPRYAGEAHYLLGELQRMTGHFDLAEEAFTKAYQLGRVPQPGLARVRMAQGRVDSALKGLQLALDADAIAPMRRAQLLTTLAEALIAVADIDAAAATAAQLQLVAREIGSDYLKAVACATEARVLLARNEEVAALRRAGQAVEGFRALGLRYDEARAREVRGMAARMIHQDDAAKLELTSAYDALRSLGAEPDVRRVGALLGAPPSPLSFREIEVLRLVARGHTNKVVAAELIVSEHTVARHLSNIYTKLGVSSRSAATAFAYEHSLI